jgi:hypothetical protein
MHVLRGPARRRDSGGNLGGNVVARQAHERKELVDHAPAVVGAVEAVAGRCGLCVCLFVYIFEIAVFFLSFRPPSAPSPPAFHPTTVNRDDE